MSSASDSAAIHPQNINGLSNGSLLQKQNFVQANSESFSEWYSFVTAQSEPPTIDCNSFDEWSYDSTTFNQHCPSPIASSLGSSIVWTSHAAAEPLQYGSLSPLTETPLSYWNCERPLMRLGEICVSSATQPFASPFYTHTEATESSYPIQHQPDYNHTIRDKNTTSPLFVNNAASSRSTRASRSRSRLRPKTLHCPNCELSFARASDLQRHIDGIHLRIRHHCRVSGCGDNDKKGWCRLEKLKGHMQHVHGQI
ncbi:uncharacterized protein LY89DRAFT_666216 [Mollisia scopiformis]|uniref:C2H2-type domain-containing protein n=1 Tax=Mollisia scopiformis TaxID=149040 RepID=A0A194XK67_MOLSC|nr:uncharacterized protein LY89DRAFT_666216 [Mollisia scopiformis]KUJ20553.1 hypothetical protein LY89DRAFT_666216 [Mollisia scopiformis]